MHTLPPYSREASLRDFIPALLVFALACGAPAQPESPSSPPAPDEPAEPVAPDQPVVPGDDPQVATYWRDAKPVLHQHCEGCHSEGGIAPFALDSFDDAYTWKDTLPPAIDSGAMPPWPPAGDCTDLVGDRTMPQADADALLTWIDEGGEEGDPADWVAPQPPTSMAIDHSLQVVEPYRPAPDEYDDHRCFVVDWPEDEQVYLTGQRFEAGRRDWVHHMLAYAIGPAAVDTVRALDAADPEPGYPCVGGVLGPSADLDALGEMQGIGGWVPGVTDSPLPDGTGIAMEPGSVIVMQFHYNTLYAPADQGEPDQSTLHVQVADDVPLPATSLFLVDLLWLSDGGMSIPAGDADVHHETATSGWLVNLSALDVVGLGQPMWLHTASLHMHQLGRSGSVSVLRDGDPTQEECVLAIDDWDFGWQGSYTLQAPIELGVDDEIRLACQWDNSAANQPWVGGTQQDPIDVQWGDNSLDEMCLGSVLVTAAP